MSAEQKIVMLAADTARTSAYAQALAHAGIAVSSAALVVPDSQRWGQTSSPPTPSASLEDLFLPDVAVPALDACRVICEQVDVLRTNSINDPMCIQWLAQEAADLVTKGLSAAIADQQVTYDLARLMEPKVDPVSCSGFAEAIIRRF